MRSRRKLNSPVSIAIGVAVVMMLFVIIICALFSAMVYDSSQKADAKLEYRMNYYTKYYDAETVASEILTGNADEIYNKTIASDTRIIYRTDLGEIEVIKAGGSTSFEVPVTKRECLKVNAVVSGKNIDIVQWSIEKAAQ